MIDFRSDTVTRPTPAMRRAMAQAVVGDDVLGDDPTVKELEAEFAEVLGKEAALFLPSGSMANLCAVLVHTRPGDECVMEERTHTFLYEAGASCRYGGVQIRTFSRESGIPEPEDLLACLRDPKDLHEPRSTLFVLENTHNMAGGRVVPPERVRELADLAHEHGLLMHLDGARLFNAAVASGVDVSKLAEPADSVMCCLSKGLGAPIGSCLAGSTAFIAEARRVRKSLGGGMRQVGVIAAPGLLALREGPGRLHEDHARARKLAAALDRMPGLSVDLPRVETNMVMAEAEGYPAGALAGACQERGVAFFALTPGRLRFVLHRDVSEGDLHRATRILSEVAEALSRGEVPASREAETEPWNE